MRHPLLLLALSLAFLSSAHAGPREEALAVVERWAQAFTASDVDAITALYAPEALFFGTGSKTLVTRPEDIRAYFERGLLTNRPRGATLGEHQVAVISDTVVVVTGMDTVTSVREGVPTRAIGRVSFVIAKQGDAWRIVHFHRSVVPE
jgi:uncharacterized protein (TIGR02246 family)